MLVLFLSTTLMAQRPGGDQRTTETKIADLLMQLPAKNSADYNRIMKDLSGMGEAVVANITPNLVAPGKGDDTQLRYAISGLVKYVSDGNDKSAMQTVCQSLVKALGNAKDDEVKDFLLQELQYVAGEGAIPAVSPLLKSQRLCDPAARVLIRINNEQSGKALADALNGANTAQQTILVKALGEVGYKPALGAVQNLASTGDQGLKKAVLEALAQFADPSSAKLMEAEALKVNHTFDNTGANAAYFVYLKNLTENGNGALAAKSAKKLVSGKAVPVATQNAGLYLLAKANGNKAVPALMKALNSGDKTQRVAAQHLLGDFYTPETSAQIIKKASGKVSPELKSELIYLLGEKKEKAGMPLFVNALKDSNPDVRISAIHAVSMAGEKEAIAPLISTMVNGDAQTVAAASKALMTIEGEGVADAAAAAITQASPEARVALIGILAEKQASKYSGVVFDQAATVNPKVREASASALSSLVKPGDAEKVAALLNNASAPAEIAALQKALYQSLQGTGTSEQQVATVIGLMKDEVSKSDRYYNVLGSIGGDAALAAIENEMNFAASQHKGSAVKALSSWSDASALPLLFSIARENSDKELKNTALNGFIQGINRSKEPADQKVLMFRNAMELASTIINRVAANPTFMALVFVARYLDDADLQQAAVQSVRNIVTSNTALYGPVVQEIVDKSIALNKDEEAEYQKQALLKHMASLPKEGFVAMFNGKDLTGWKGLVGNPISRGKMTPAKLAEEQAKADERMRRDWRVENGVLIFEGEGYDNLCSEKMYADFELYLDWRMEAKGDGGVYLRGTPQVQTWDTSRVDAGAQVGSGGLYNNQVNVSKPLVVADNPIDEWNTFYIKMIGDKVTVYLNGVLVTDNVVLENYWDRKLPIFEKEAIELQAHGTKLEFRDVYVREIPRPEPFKVTREEEAEGFVPMFNGIDLAGWTGNKVDYFAQEGMLVCQPSGHGSGNLYTEKEYGDFIMRFEFQLTPGANNGLGIRTPTTGDAAYVGMELQILDNEAEIYKNLKPYQYHGSVYGVIAAKRGFLKPLGEWNVQEVQAIGSRIKITLNGEVIVDGDIAEASKNGTATADGLKHPGLLNPAGHIGFLGHGSPLKFRNLRIKEVK
jgi:HEAT repeat protein